jgi:hypothetical protein
MAEVLFDEVFLSGSNLHGRSVEWRTFCGVEGRATEANSMSVFGSCPALF